MNIIFHILTRIRNLVFHPVKEWEAIAAETHNRITIFMRFVAPLLCLIAVAVIVGTWFSTSREVYSISYVCYVIAFLWTSISAGLYLSAFLIAEIMAGQVNSKDHCRSFALMAYSSGVACLVIALVALFPFFKEMLVLAFYSCYLYWQGIPFLIQAQGQKQIIYGLLSFIVVILTYLVIFFFFGKIWAAILLSSG